MPLLSLLVFFWGATRSAALGGLHGPTLFDLSRFRHATDCDGPSKPPSVVKLRGSRG